MESPLYSILIILLIILLNSLFVIAEISVLTSSKAKIKNMISGGKNGAKKALELMENPEFFLSTVQVGITFMSIFLGIYSGKSLALYIEPYIKNLALVGEYYKIISDSLVLIFITYFTVLGEIIPKRIAMLYPEKVSSNIAYSIYLCSKIVFPIVKLLDISTKLVLKTFNINTQKSAISNEEIKLLINQAGREGSIKPDESDMLGNLMQLGNIQAGAIMTPRNKIRNIDIGSSISENIKILSETYYSYFPVISGKKDNIIGVLSAKSVMGMNLKSDFKNIETKIESCLYVPEMISVLKLLETFKKEKAHFAMVVDEYGDIEGLITLNDIFKVIIGDFAIHHEGKVPNIHQEIDGSYLLKGNTLIEEVAKIMYLPDTSAFGEGDFRNIAGFILHRLNKVPQSGDNFIFEGWKFKVMKMHKKSISEISLKQLDKIIKAE